MKIQINEVWNREGRTEPLTTIETLRSTAQRDVFEWIATNRPDLVLATGLNDHGFHASEVR